MDRQTCPLIYLPPRDLFRFSFRFRSESNHGVEALSEVAQTCRLSLRSGMICRNGTWNYKATLRYLAW